MRKFHIATLATTFATLVAATLVAQEQPRISPAEDIAPPGELNLAAPQAEEVVPAPNGRREGGILSGRDLDLGQLQKEFGPQGRRFLNRNGDRGISFGRDMAERGINFGLRFANGNANPSEARAFGLEMGRRGRAFGLEMRDEMRDEALELGDELGDKANDPAPKKEGDPKFEATPGDIKIEAPPLPLGQIHGREATDRPVKFRREF